MYRYKNILVCLNLSQVDASVLRYAGLLTRTAKSERAWFIHVVSKANLPDSFLKEYPQLAPAVDDMMQQRLAEAVNGDFQGFDGTEKILSVLEGDKLKVMLGQIQDNNADLVIVGRKTEQSGRDSLEKQLARRAPCSVLIVPQGSAPSITRVLCAVDFSEFSVRALDKALLYCRHLGLPALHVAHYYGLPTGYHKAGLSADEFATRLEPHLHKEFDEFLARVETRDVTVQRIVRRAGDVATAICDELKAVEADLLVLGSRGRSGPASALLGTLPEKMIWKTDTPMLVVKEKGEGAGLLKLLLDSL
jgi:nucleotide-binding universal stress UspA family protein